MIEAAPRGRWLPPVHSPVGARALWSGAAAWVGGGDGAVHAVEGWIRARWGPAQHVLTDSGTTALAMALRMGVARQPAPVALPAWGCYDIATAADQAAVPFLFYDLDPRTLGPAPDSLRAALDAGARTVVLAHLYGVPVDVAAVRRLAGPGVVLVEDAAQAPGADLHGVPAGGAGDIAVLSFGRGKGITGGGGGALLLNEAGLAEQFHAEAGRLAPGGRGGLLALSRLKAQWFLSRPGLYGLPASLPFLGLGETPYRAPAPEQGMAGLTAGVLRQTLRRAEDETRARRRHAAWLLEALQGLPAFTPIAGGDGLTPGWLRLPLLGPPGGWRTDRATRRLGIMPGYPLALPRLPGFGTRAEGRMGAVPGAERLARELVTLPVHSQLGERDLEALVGRLRTVLGGVA